ncbi:MAG: FAD-dependent monooxygenase [Kineosporiaceae bacterium]
MSTEHGSDDSRRLGTATADAPVVIVGAGVSGLTAALHLASLDIPSTVLDRVDGTTAAAPPTTRPGSLGSVAGPGDLAVWDRADRGIAAEILALGSQPAHEEIRWGRRRRHTVSRSRSAPGRSIGVPYPSLRGALLRAAGRHPLVEVRGGARVVGVLPGPRDVTLLLGDGVVTAPWVVAADGPRSTLRVSSGIATSTVALGHVVLTFDVRGDASFRGLGPARLSWFSPPSAPASHLLVTPRCDDTWRLDWTHPRTVDLEGEERSGRLHRRLAALVGPSGWTVSSATIRRVAHHVADSYRSGRVLLVGDAAGEAVLGDGGLGPGVSDSVAAAEALAIAIREPRSADRAVARYAVQRRAEALGETATRLRAVRRRVPDSIPTRALLTGALLAAPWSATARRYLVGRSGQADAGRPPDDAPTRPTIPAPTGPTDAADRLQERV